MFRNLIPLILIIASSSAMAGPGLDVRPGVDFQENVEEIQDQDLVPVSEIMQVVPQCTGAPACAQFVEMDPCLTLGEPLSCFWSVE